MTRPAMMHATSLRPVPGRAPAPPRAPARAAGACALALIALLAPGCRRAPDRVWQGYVEAEFVHVAAPLGGALARLAVARGTAVAAGDLLFELDPLPEHALLGEATQRLAQARARLDNLRKGRRPSELAALEAHLQRARASLDLAALELARRTKLRQQDVIAGAEFDLAQARRDADAAQVAALQAELQTAQLGARSDEIAAAEAEVEAAVQAERRARWALESKRPTAPLRARVHDTLYRPGEFVAAGQPVVVLLPPENLKLRFFVPEPRLAELGPGQAVRATFNGAGAPLTATISYLSSQAEFTPPVIYSTEQRAKLVFMIEARVTPEDAARLRPGQPVQVEAWPGRDTPTLPR